MKFWIFFFALIVVGIWSTAQIPNGNIGNTTERPSVYAVVVGISSYKDSTIEQLQYANADAIAFAGFLQSKTGGSVQKENIRLLTDSNATQAAVILAINWLAKVCKKDDLVFFYFSGHGDVESVSMFNNAYLICYNTSRDVFEGMSLSVDKLNDIAKTLSARTQANVVLITDACRSGKIIDSNPERNQLLGERLLASTEKEIRIASCKPDQLSNEGDQWGGGRGVFSYHLVNGLKGSADANKDAVVTVSEIRSYMETAMKNDVGLAQEQRVQTPVFKDGNDNFQLSKINKEEFVTAKMLLKTDSVLIVSVNRTEPDNINNEDADVEADEYFFKLLKNENLELVTDSLHLAELDAAEIPFALLRMIKMKAKTMEGQDKISGLATALKNDEGLFTYFKENLVRIFDEKAHDIINQYLRGDEAELERRRYYNISKSGYDVYPRMFAVALKLITPDNYYYNILQVKLHYFTGVALRLKMPLTKNPAPLIEQALAEQNKALALDDRAPQIYNELGILYSLKKENIVAEKYFIEATKRKDSWALPWANLAGLYAETGQYSKGVAANLKADSLQKGLQGTIINSGYLNEKSGNLLYGEEDYRKAIDINSRHYLPFDRLGFVYLNTTKYALADSFFYEADLRKKGFNFESYNVPFMMDKQMVLPSTVRFCDVDTNLLRKDDLMAFFGLGIQEYKKKYYQLKLYPDAPNEYLPWIDNPFAVTDIPDYSLAIYYFKKVINIDRKNPLVYYYLGKVYFAQKQWEKAELMFTYALENYMNDEQFKKYYDNLIAKSAYPYPHKCFEELFLSSKYAENENYYFLASLYESWKHFDEAELMYKKIIEEIPDKPQPYIKFWQLLEKQGRYTEAEYVIKSFTVFNKEFTNKELNAFYRRAIEKFPTAAEWSYKLGLLLYDLAEKQSFNCKTDTIIWFPKINKEIFLGSDGYPGDYNDLAEDQGPGVTYTGCGKFYFLQQDSLKLIYMPVTGEWLYLSGAIYYPRYDGINYLKKAATLMANRELLGEIHFKIGNLYIWAGSKKQAYPYFAKSLEFVPGNANTRLKIVDVCTASFKNRAAFEQLGYLCDSSQINFQNRLLFSEFAMYAGQFERSKKVLDEAESINPYQLSEIVDLKGRYFLLSGNADKAISFYKLYLTEVPNDMNTCYTLARLYAIKKDNKEAINWLNKAVGKGFNYLFILKSDPVMQNLRNTTEWIMATKNIKGKNWTKRDWVTLDGGR